MDVVELLLNHGRFGPGVEPEEIVAVVRSWTRRTEEKGKKGLLVGYWERFRNIARYIIGLAQLSYIRLVRYLVNTMEIYSLSLCGLYIYLLH